MNAMSMNDYTRNEIELSNNRAKSYSKYRKFINKNQIMTSSIERVKEIYASNT